MFMARVIPRRRTGFVDQAEGPRFQPMAILKGLLAAFVFSFVLFAIVSLVFTYTSFSDSFMPLVATFAGVFSVIFGGFRAAKLAGRGALLNGSMVGLLYGLVVLALGVLALSEPLGSQVLWRMGVAVLCGAVGGLIAPLPRPRRKH